MMINNKHFEGGAKLSTKLNTSKLISTLLTLALIFSLFATTAFAATSTFKDVPTTHWANSAVERAYADGAVQGSSVAANGEKLYAPNGKLTIAEFITMLTRAFYADELASAPAGSAWYSAAETVATYHGLMEGVKITNDFGWVPAKMTDNATRYAMAKIMYNILIDKDYPMPTQAQMDAVHPEDARAQSFIPAVDSSVALGLITGKDAKGTFDGFGIMTRAEAAAVYVRLADLLSGNITPSLPTIEEPKNTGNYGPVGTISDEPVTLALSTHKPVVDYWADLSSDLKAIIPNKDYFNAAVQTIKDRDIATKDNVYYNFACCDDLDSSGYTVTYAMRDIGYDCEPASNADSNKVARFFKRTTPTDQVEVFAPIFARFTNGMSDMQKAQIMLDEVNRRFDYGDGDFSWTDGNTTGDCDVFALVVCQIFKAADIPCMMVDMNTYLGGHTAAYAYLDGAWYIVDATESEHAGREGIMMLSKHASRWQYDENKILNYTENIIADALLKAAYN